MGHGFRTRMPFARVSLRKSAQRLACLAVLALVSLPVVDFFGRERPFGRESPTFPHPPGPRLCRGRLLPNPACAPDGGRETRRQGPQEPQEPIPANPSYCSGGASTSGLWKRSGLD
jgi:hypothetical protein